MPKPGLPTRRQMIATAAALAAWPAANAQGSKFPSRQIRIVVPFPPGGLTDAYARMYGEQLMQQLGATVVINGAKEDTIARCQQFTEDMGADIVFETAGSAVTVKQAPYLVMRGGKIMIVGTVPGDSAINFLKINREVTIQTVFRYANRYPVTIEAISSGRFDVKSMVTHIYDYRDVQQAFEESVNNKRDIIKGVIKISD